MSIDNVEDLNTGNQRLDVRADALEELSRRGLIRTVQASQRPSIPHRITDLDDDELGDLLNQISVYGGFVEEEVAKAKSELDGAKAQETFTKARVRIELRQLGRKLKPDEARDLMETDKRVLEARSRTLYFHAIYDYAVAIQKGVQQDWDTVSRRITQRGQEVDRFRRGTNVENQREPTAHAVSPFMHVPHRRGQ